MRSYNIMRLETKNTKTTMNNLMRLARTYNKQFCQVLQDYTKLEEEGLGITELEEYYTSNNNKHMEG